ncbi:D-alanine--D-alanine ligase [Paenibacillus chitinolyticus]|uniref:D-alanine--D-alanine ligase n=1 Tax=Paenibacillus chitinolyticus TaxID=79263 RepID=A0A410X3N0_9BACL|nr:D-alanine--D-alanine ligase [Paenibacillus chitinolyticus]MCY9593179.1 D-alanine--D-alanine ligase [Paenibacillus chitinolyticus]MCY9595304.1 D-alanine--D-alanine ligase [Paenibacillus chitinolyticus]QAV21219.1 D-alanine--D-alanine ligase [Paenibacillus chitinolyticus]
MSRKLRIGLIYGGKSGEHEVSLQTAHAVIGALDVSKYEITPFYITKQGEWRRGAALNGRVERKELLAFDASEGEAAGAALAPFFSGLTSQAGGVLAEVAAAGEAAREEAVDVVLPLLHGTFGEDGTIQGLLEMANIPYVGAGVLASAVGMDKVAMKKMFAQEGLPQCVYRHFTRSQWEKDQPFFLMETEISIGYPCFIKPANLGSSVGISKARNRQELIEAVEYAFQFDRKVIVEEFVDAREIEVAILGNEEPLASVPGEIVSSSEFYDYKAKYVDGKSTMVIPAELPEETAAQIRELAIQAFQSIDGSGLSRVDFFLTRTDGQIYINEINTMPGFTPFSMYPLLWKETGKPYAELLDDLIRLALERHTAKQQIKYTVE